MRFFYNLFIFIYSLGVRLASIQSAKAKSFIQGRVNWQGRLNEVVKNDSKNIWVHVASLGEYEQALPVLEKLNDRYPNYNIVLTFFSPSGFEHAKLPAFIKHKHYLALDTRSNAKQFLDIVNPSLILFVKYDIWFNYLDEAKKRGIPSILFSALFRDNQVYFKSYGNLMRHALGTFNKIFVQNEDSQQLLKSIEINGEVAGDTRYDRVRSRMENGNVHEAISAFLEGDKAIVFGSTWKDDLEAVIPFINKSTDKIIVAPHNIGKSEVDYLFSKIDRKALRFSEHESSQKIESYEVMVIDNIGMLASVYSVGKLAYVGGAFHGSLHNILEPAVFGIPVIFGPEHSKFPEAALMIDAACGFQVSSADEFEKLMKEMNDPDFINAAGKKADEFVRQNLGSSDRIMEGISSLLEKSSK